MTRQESFKRRIRERMAATGEKYGAARRQLIEKAESPSGRTWVAEPEMSDDAIREATGRGWDEWCDLIDAWPANTDGHTAIATHVREDHGIDGWWAQAVTVSYERITGLRLPHQRADGTFSADKTRTVTVTVDAEALRALLLDDDDRRDLFPGLDTELRSRPTSKVPRIAIGPGVAQIALEQRDDGRVRISIAHERLPSADDVPQWKQYWSEWLAALDAADG
ncbi:MAG: hypothetical protein ACR2JF_04740 [Iamia sp.]